MNMPITWQTCPYLWVSRPRLDFGLAVYSKLPAASFPRANPSEFQYLYILPRFQYERYLRGGEGQPWDPGFQVRLRGDSYISLSWTHNPHIPYPALHQIASQKTHHHMNNPTSRAD